MIIPKPDGMVRDMQKPAAVSEHLNNMVIARSIVQVVRRVPWIVDMSTGSLQAKVTYGRGGHVSGVVLRYTESGASVVEVGVVIAEKAIFDTEVLSAASERSSDLNAIPTLLRLAEQLRAVIYHATLDLGLSVLTEIDVSIDDIR